jgi:parafibromin
MDPLSVLRSFATSKDLGRVTQSDNEIDFGGRARFEKNAPTAYKSEQGKGPFYDLETLLFFARSLERPEVSLMDYFKEAKDKGVKPVRAIDRKDLENYLTGKIDTSVAIQTERADKREGQEGLLLSEPPGEVPTHLEQHALRDIMANERQLRNRNSMLSIPGRSFEKVLDLLDLVLRKDAERERKEEDGNKKRRVGPAVGPRPSGRYERETAQDGALKQIGAQNLGVEQVGFGTLAPEVVVTDPQVMNPPPPSAPSRPPTHASGKKPKPKPQLKPDSRQQDRNLTPIIMVPPAASALMNMANVKPFLEQGIFCAPGQAVFSEQHSHNYLRIMRTMGRPAPGVKYHVTDKEPSTKEDWDRVVAVFALGKPWQFKKFPFAGASSGDMVDTFQKVCGVYLHYGDEPVDPQVKRWNVKLLKISRHSRDKDGEVLREFWGHLDSFLQAKKSKLLY